MDACDSGDSMISDRDVDAVGPPVIAHRKPCAVAPHDAKLAVLSLSPLLRSRYYTPDEVIRVVSVGITLRAIARTLGCSAIAHGLRFRREGERCEGSPTHNAGDGSKRRSKPHSEQTTPGGGEDHASRPKR